MSSHLRLSVVLPLVVLAVGPVVAEVFGGRFLRVSIEAALIGAVLLPVALFPPLRARYAELGQARKLALAAMLVLSLAGQLVLGTRSFPFVKWNMYATKTQGDPVVYRYDALLSSGRRQPLVASRFLGRESAARFMEALRRQVEANKSRSEHAPPSAEHVGALRAFARLYEGAHPDDPVAAVLVSQKTIARRSGTESAPKLLWRVPAP